MQDWDRYNEKFSIMMGKMSGTFYLLEMAEVRKLIMVKMQDVLVTFPDMLT